ncbi:MAG: hypothetical protein F6K22_04865, partial [Okeania sp. SIO2F4]|nr:hypothetical protein [Okeania sp. SIO2F4]
GIRDEQRHVTGLQPCALGTAPTLEQMQKLQDFIDSQDRAVAIHCTSGRRRTGTVLAGYLINSGSSYDDALRSILIANPEIDLRESQSNFLRDLAKN